VEERQRTHCSSRRTFLSPPCSHTPAHPNMNDYGYPASGGGNRNKNYEPFR